MPNTPAMTRLHFVIALSSVAIVGCNASTTTPPVTSSVAATDVTKPMVGQWGVDGEVSLIITLQDDRVVISAPANDTWRMDIHDAKIVNDSIHFVQKNYLHNGDAHPFNGVACNSIAKLIDDDKLEFRLTTVHSPDVESDILTRIE